MMTSFVPRLLRTVTGTISSLNRPASMAAIARRWLLRGEAVLVRPRHARLLRRALCNVPIDRPLNAHVSPSYCSVSTSVRSPSGGDSRGSTSPARLMLSIPPATTTCASPHRTACAASITAFNPDPHTLFTVTAATVAGSPALSAACRAGACPTPADSTLPRMTSSTFVESTPLRSTAARTATAPSSPTGTLASAPRNLPIGVRHADTR